MALANPEMFARSYAKCDRCEGGMYCDACVERAGGKCPNCGAKVNLQGGPPGPSMDPETAKRVIEASGGMEAAEKLAKRLIEQYEAEKGGATSTPGPSRPSKLSKPSKLSERAPASAAAGESTQKVAKVIRAALVFTTVVLGIPALVMWLAPADSAIEGLGRVGRNIGVTALVGLVLAPWLGSLTTLGLVYLLKFAPKLAIGGVKLMKLVWGVAIVWSPAFVWWANTGLAWDGWRIAWSYAAILGALVGGYFSLRQLVAMARKQGLA